MLDTVDSTVRFTPQPIMSGSAEVFIAGLGTVSPMGKDVAEFWQSLFQPPASPLRDAIGGFPDDGKSWCHGYAIAAAQLPEPDASLSRFELLSLKAIAEACADAGRGDNEWREVSIGLAIGTAAGETETAEAARLAGATPTFVACNPYRIVERLPELIALPIDGPVFLVSNACSAALYAMAQAADLIADGTVDAMLVVGVEVLSRVTQAGFQKMTALDPDRCRPFDGARNGTVLGEGAAALLLVSSALADRLRQKSYCRLTAFGASCDAYHPTTPHPEGRDIRAAVQRALQAAGLKANQIGIVVPHGTGTPLNDRIEGDMLAEAFYGQMSDMHVMPIKSHLGHCAGASGAFSVLAAAKALACGRIPPTLHIETADPAVPLHFSRSPASMRPKTARRALVNAYGFGGNNLSAVLEAASHG